MGKSYDKGRGFTLTRLLNAPVALVWRAWTEPGQLDWFFNPETRPSLPPRSTCASAGPGGSTW